MSPYGKRGLIVRLVYLLLAIGWWVATGFGLAGRRRVVVLCYHNVRDDQCERFSRQMRRIARRTEKPVEGGSIWGLPRVVVTFDDAFAGLLKNALPVMGELNIPVTIFAVTENLGMKPNWAMTKGHPDRHERTMTESELKFIDQDSLCRVESHTSTHASLTEINLQQVREELNHSKQVLGRILGRDVTMFAFPYGEYGSEVIRDAQMAGYSELFTLQPTLGRMSRSETVHGRFAADPDMWATEFFLTAVGAYAWLGPWRGQIAYLRRSSPIQARPIPDRKAA